MTKETYKKGKNPNSRNGFKKGHSNLMLKQSKETREKISNNNSKYWLGKNRSEETKRKISLGNKDKVVSEDARLKMSIAKKGTKVGKHNSNWRGGTSREPYSVDWTDDLKRAIRKRDRYTCQICGVEPAVFVHHIDYDKKNCNLDNLITLCSSCHSKTNFNRNKWIKYFNKKLNARTI